MNKEQVLMNRIARLEQALTNITKADTYSWVDDKGRKCTFNHPKGDAKIARDIARTALFGSSD